MTHLPDPVSLLFFGIQMKVLISPVSVEEAELLLDTPVDIIDVKNVNEGSLGAQFPWITGQIVRRAAGRPVSATLGDLPCKPGTAALAAYAAAAVGASYVKAGLHGAASRADARRMMVAVRRAVRMVSQSAQVVACGYADYRLFGGLTPSDLVAGAADASCDAVMLDTAVKNGQSLFDHLNLEQLHEFLTLARQAGMRTALAGSLSLLHAPWLHQLQPEWIGVRGAVCQGPDRHSAICPQRTCGFLEHFQQPLATPSTRRPVSSTGGRALQ